MTQCAKRAAERIEDAQLQAFDHRLGKIGDAVAMHEFGQLLGHRHAAGYWTRCHYVSPLLPLQCEPALPIPGQPYTRLANRERAMLVQHRRSAEKARSSVGWRPGSPIAAASREGLLSTLPMPEKS